jgi:hypothetical protein
MRRADRLIHFPAKEDLNQNQPIHGIILEDAQAYITCLSSDRADVAIPYEDEVKSLYEARWRKYAGPVCAELRMARLREAAKKLNGTAPLLKEVGSFHGQQGR